MLLLDCGNTALKCQLDDQHNTFYLDDRQFETRFIAYIKSINSNTCVVLSSVASIKILQIITTVLNAHFNKAIRIAKTEDNVNALTIAYKEPKQLGVDRWLTMIATQHIKTTRIIVDAGSWLKMDVVLANGQHLGGVIISKSKQDEALLFNRLNINKLACKTQQTLFGASTQQCLCLSLHQYGFNAINTLLTQWLGHLKQPCQLIISGGDAQNIKQSIKKLDKTVQKYILDIQQKENLVLLGLSTLFNS